jgi:hypothetical protein
MSTQLEINNIIASSGNFTNLIVNNTGVSVSGHSHTVTDIQSFANEVADIVGTTVVAGTGISVQYNTSLNQLTINSTGTSGSDNIKSYDNTQNFPATGIVDTLYISKDLSKLYRWTGSAYIELGPIGVETSFPSNITGDILVSGDSNYSSVAILLHGDSSFVDSSSYAHVATSYGNVASTGLAKFGSASLTFDGNGDYLTFPSNAVFNLTGDFTLEAWVKFTADANSYAGAYGVAIASRYNGGSGGNTGWQWRINGQTYTSINLYTGQTDLNFNGSAISQNVWHHVAITRSGSTIKAFVDGQQYGDAVTNSDSFTPSSANVLSVGRLSYEATYIFDFIGQIDDLRITNGVARYTSNFSVPTAAFANSAPYTLSSVTFSVTGNS